MKSALGNNLDSMASGIFRVPSAQFLETQKSNSQRLLFILSVLNLCTSLYVHLLLVFNYYLHLKKIFRHIKCAIVLQHRNFQLTSGPIHKIELKSSVGLRKKGAHLCSFLQNFFFVKAISRHCPEQKRFYKNCLVSQKKIHKPE